uniref:C-type lectin domain-containing protein n=1 Tax=Panagrolaimus sp. ES5 TaxID=591445 RepID=A0AC34FIH2_9BILA
MFDNMFISGEAVTLLFVSSDFWIGANNFYQPGNWSWIDGTPFDFSDWEKGQPTSSSSCATANSQNGQWLADDCFNAKPSVCELDALPSFTTTSVLPKPISCQPSWTYYVVNGTIGYCYKVMDNATWIDAEDIYLGYWPGAEACSGFGQAWIGAYSDNYGVDFYWTDGTPFNYTAWPTKSDGKPTHSLSRSCIVKYLTTECNEPASTFANWPCKNIPAKFICKKLPQ